MNVLYLSELVYLPRYALSKTAKWPNMGILLQQEMGVIGWLPADVSACVIDQRGKGSLFCCVVPHGAQTDLLQLIFKAI